MRLYRKSLQNTRAKPFNSPFSVLYFTGIKQKVVIPLRQTFKTVCSALLCLSLLAGCTVSPAPAPSPTASPTPSVSTEPTPTPTPEPTQEPTQEPELTEKPVPSPETSPAPTPTEEPDPEPVRTLEESFPLRLAFSSGAGGWGTELVIRQDLSFTGIYSDSDMGSVGEGHPHGTRYICNFSGQFAQLSKLDDYSYSLTLAELTSDYEEGKEWIEGQILHVSSVPYGIESGTEFILYLPHTPTAGLSEEFLSWWPGRYGSSTSAALDFFGLFNVEMGYGFFGDTLIEPSAPY